MEGEQTQQKQTHQQKGVEHTPYLSAPPPRFDPFEYHSMLSDSNSINLNPFEILMLGRKACTLQIFIYVGVKLVRPMYRNLIVGVTAYAVMR